jgi:hypothetical protein
MKTPQQIKSQKHREKMREYNKTHKIDPENTMRKCTGTCGPDGKTGTEKPLSDFPKDPTKKFGYAHMCKICKLKANAIRDALKNDKTLDPNVATKKCSTKNDEECCGQVKKLIYFSKQSTGTYGYANLCKDCRKKQRRKNIKAEKIIITEKICSGCKKQRIVSEFNHDTYSKDGYQTVCKECQKIRHGISYSILLNFMTQVLKNARGNAKKKGLSFDITKDDIIELYDKQCGLCALTGEKMTHNSINDRQEDDPHILNPKNISIDRIDSSVGYKKGNIQLVCAIVNIIKFEMTDEQLFDFCSNIYLTRSLNIIKDIDEYYEFTKTGKIKEQIKLSHNEINFINYKYTNTIHNAKSRNLKVKITHDDIVEQYNKQNGRCVLTNVKLTFDKQCNSDLSIDRIDSSNGYTKNNIQLISNLSNKSKSDIDDDMFKEWIAKIRLFYFTKFA